MEKISYTGFHSIEELLKKKRVRGILYYSRSSKRIDAVVDMAKDQGYKVQKVSEAEVTELCRGSDHRGFVFIVSSTEISDEMSRGMRGKNANNLDTYLENLKSPTALVIILDGVTDPHNLGAIIRSADQFDVDHVIIPSRNSAKDNSTVAKTSSGADNYVAIDVVPNLGRAMDKLKKEGFWIYGAHMKGTSICQADFSGRVALVMGSEGRGLRELTETKCDILVSVPTGGHVDSLNVSVAAGIMLYEIRRQQNLP